jgi:hypothetical protein
MSDLATYIELGFRHIVDLKGADHILFLLALAAIYRFKDWRECLWVATAFTAGHSLTLALAVTNTLVVPSSVIEFRSPVTIVATRLENLLVRERDRARGISRYRPILAGVFGLVHGAGFANYLRSLFVDRIALPLFGFNVGIELGQICVLIATFVAFTAVDRAIAAVRASRTHWVEPLRIRTVAVSSIALLVATRWAVERAPW